MADINRIHVSPGVYASETVDMKAAASSLGITKLALVGETLKGPAFQPYWVHSPKEYASVFGGTSPKKFAGSNYPQYELPYIANEYLKEGTELCVVKTLGFSGYNAGPAWAITGKKSGNNDRYVIAIIRSRGTYKFNPELANKKDANGCECGSAFDSMTFDVGEISNVVSCDGPKRYNLNAVKLTEYTTLSDNGSECTSYSLSGKTAGFGASYGDLGRFTIKCIVGAASSSAQPGDSEYSAQTVSIPVSLNKADKDYIVKVLGTSNSDGDQPLYVESLYDVAWEDAVVNNGFDTVNSALTAYQVGYAADYCGIDPVSDILTKYPSELRKSDIGKRFLYAANLTDGSPESIACYSGDTEATCQEAHIYTVAEKKNASGKKEYYYSDNGEHLKYEYENLTNSQNGVIVYNQADGLYYKNGGNPVVLVSGGIQVSTEFTVGTLGISVTSGNLWVENAPTDSVLNYINGSTSTKVGRNDDGTWSVTSGNKYVLITEQEASGTIHNVIYYENENIPSAEKKETVIVNDGVTPVTCDLNDYKSKFRYSSTPWVVSNAKGDTQKIELNKLFRFHTISDGDTSVTEVKVSIENIRPDSGEFDVVVRGYADSDASVNVLERFGKCTMAPGKNNIAYKIGTIDGTFESKSKYITVEVNDTMAAKNSVPAGFIGYPIPVYNGTSIVGSGTANQKNTIMPPITYNTRYDEDTAKRKQYFGISDRTGYDSDYFTFKGNMATLEDPGFVTNGFHLDCRVNSKSYEQGQAPKISVDGVVGYVFDTVDVNSRTSSLPNAPIIGTEDEMSGSIFEDVKLRKFTMAFAGGFDGWDVYRDQRTNTDDFSYAEYKGFINNSTGTGYSFDIMSDADSYGIEGRAITSDYYSTLAGVSLLKNPEEVDINLLATPGIDTINNSKLVNEVFNILEDRADTFYVVTTPDKEMGASDYADDIPDVDSIVADFTDEEMYSDYAATFYPWVKIEDDGEYVWLPATRDVVRNMAESDNTNTTMNLAPAGTTRGRVDAIRARKNLKNGESDELYEANINPVRTYAQEGVVIMGQKTLRKEDDLLNRIDVRRMVLRMRKLIAIGCLGLIFEPNDNNTVKSFRSIISGIMQGFIDNRAIEKWTMEVDDSEETRDRLELGATIYIKPIRALEYITLNFVVTNNDVYFEN